MRWELTLLVSPLVAEASACPLEADICQRCCGNESSYDCSPAGLQHLTPGMYQGLRANYLSYNTEIAVPNLKVRAREFEECTGGKIMFSEAANLWLDPLEDLKGKQGNGIYHGYLMSYSHFPEASALGLADDLLPRLRASNPELQWETTFPQVQQMGRYRSNGTTQLHFLMYDGDFFVPIVRIDLLERDQIPLPNTWEEAIDLARRYNNTDLNDDGEPDFGLCYFPERSEPTLGWWWAELMYSIWATYGQIEDSSQGFLFDPETLEPQLGVAFQTATKKMKELLEVGTEGCMSDAFATGRCALALGPPGCWKGIFLNGVSRKDADGTVLWRPTMLDGSYAEPYRFKPFGTTHVEHSGTLKECTLAFCPAAEYIPTWGPHGSDDRALALPPSPLAGKLVNRAPFYWSGGLGILLRKTAPEELKALLWDFMVYTNSASTSAKDVASYASWLDSWRSSHLPEDGGYFLEAGWSQVAYREHRNMMLWAFSLASNGAFNLRLPGAKTYTKTVMGDELAKYIAGDISDIELHRRVLAGWKYETEKQGILQQLRTYRASLGLRELQDAELCRLHWDAMEQEEPSVCVSYVATSGDTYLTALIVVVSLLVLAGLMSGVAFVFRTSKAKKKLLKEKEESLEKTVSKGLTTVRELGYPMAIIGAKDFISLSEEELGRCHEGLRDMGLIQMHDTVEEISYFHEMDNIIVFFSYHWPSWERLGPDQVQRTAMNHSLELYSEQEKHPLEKLWVWLDIISIPQKHRGIQLLAINSLYVYAYSVDILVIIAPETTQSETGEMLGLDSYKNRVWTRVEQVAHLSAHGIDSLYLYEPWGLRGVDAKWLEDVVHVFDGQTTCCAKRHVNFETCDRESLVLPLLGLYYRVAAAERRGIDQNWSTKTLYDMIEANRDKAFPRTFEHVSVVEGRELRRRKILFGDLLERVDRHLELFDLETLHARIHHSPMMKSIRSARLAAVSPCSVGGVASMTLSQMAERLFLEDDAVVSSRSVELAAMRKYDIEEQFVELRM